MTIVCLGWGSLIWEPKGLLVAGAWHIDGPELPIEFLRQSENGRLTLVIDDDAKPLRTLWASMTPVTLDEAAAALCEREGTNAKSIGRWPSSDQTFPHQQNIANWAKQRDVTGVVWTALPPKFEGKSHRKPSVDEAVAYLNALSGDQRKEAEKYIRCAPQQIRTAYRERFESELGWLPHEKC
jgi:hypothetical protein